MQLVMQSVGALMTGMETHDCAVRGNIFNLGSSSILVNHNAAMSFRLTLVTLMIPATMGLQVRSVLTK